MSHLPPHAPGIDWNAVSAVATLVATLTAIVLAFLANISERRRHQSAAVAALGLALKTAEDAVSFFEGAEKKKTTTSDHQAKLIIGGARMQELQFNMREIPLISLPSRTAVNAYSKMRSHVMAYEKVAQLLIDAPGSAARIDVMDDLQGCRDAVATLRSELARYTPAPPK
jgi:hypothetical protein